MAQKGMSPIADAVKIVGGGLVGAGLALFLAPQSGKETRRTIVRYACTFSGKTDKAVYDFTQSMSECIDGIGTKAGEIVNSETEMTYEAKRKLLAALGKGQERIEKQKRRIAQVIG